MSEFKVDQIDHVEVFVPERYQGAKWYEEHLGIKIIKGYEHWAEHPKGPLMTSSDGGNTKLAFFNGNPKGERETAGFHILAFRVSAQGFITFLNRLERFPVKDKDGNNVTHNDVRDHGKAYSIYFTDPWGHNLEITTYDYDELKQLLSNM